jgi:hypothetical protein
MLYFIKRNNQLIATLGNIEENPYNPDTLDQIPFREFTKIEDDGAMEAAMHDIRMEEGVCLQYSH